MHVNKLGAIWDDIVSEARLLINIEPVLLKFLYTSVLKHNTFGDALIYVLSKKLSNLNTNSLDLSEILKDIYRTDNDVVIDAAYDISAIRIRDPSVTKYITPFLYFKGFHALQLYRIAHWLWSCNRSELAMYFYHYIATIFNVDIHPAALLGNGIILDHATGIVIGETAVVEDNVSIMQGVTLGSTGKVRGNRHPKIKRGVLIGAGSMVLGNIEIGAKSKIGAGSVVLHSVPPNTTVVGNPASIVACNEK